MSRYLSLNEIKQTELSILDFIDSVCKQHNIRYYLAYGTLLGAIRHKGFIPWDDDIDIYMPRKDYDRFIKLLSEVHDGDFKLLSMYNNPDYFYEYAKVVDLRTSVVLDNVKPIDDEGIWVDVFPLDNAPRYLRMVKWLINILVAFRILSVYVSFPSYKYSRMLYPFWLVTRFVGPRFFLTISDRIARCGCSSNYIGYMCSMGVSKYFFRKQWLDESVDVDFEGKKYSAFKEFDKYLHYQYGDYMKLPPVEKRVAHPVQASWKW